jgi:hypothetical protein
MSNRSWRARWTLGVSLAAVTLLVACGGGGDSGSFETPADPASSPTSTTQAQDDAFAVKVASLFIEWTPSTAQFFPFAIGEDFLGAWREAPGVNRTGCETRTSEKLGTSGAAVDSIRSVRENCSYTHGRSGALSVSQTTLQTLELWTDLTIPETAAWQYRDRYVSKQTSTYNLKLAGGLDMDGQLTGDSTWSNFTDHKADGSQTDTTDYRISGKESSRFGPSDVVLTTQIRCTFAAGRLAEPGTCLNGETRATGTIYGRPLNASLEVLSTSPMTYGINLGGERITVVVVKVGPNITDSRYRVTTPTGRELVLSGEDTLWLSIF